MVVMNDVVRNNAYSFVVCLVESLECVAGSDSSDCAITLEALPSTGANNQSSGGSGEETNNTSAFALTLSINRRRLY